MEPAAVHVPRTRECEANRGTRSKTREVGKVIWIVLAVIGLIVVLAWIF